MCIAHAYARDVEKTKDDGQNERREKAYSNVPAPAFIHPPERVVNCKAIPVGQVGPRRCEPENSTTTRSATGTLYEQCERDLDAVENLRLDSDLGLRPVRGLDNDAERRPASTPECEEQVLVLALVRGAEDAVGCDDLHLDLFMLINSV